MLNKKQEQQWHEFTLVSKRPSLRLIIERGDERREDKSLYLGANHREELRRQEDIDSKEQELEQLKQDNLRLQGRNTNLIVSKPELVLYYMSLILSVNVIFGWMAYLAFFI